MRLGAPVCGCLAMLIGACAPRADRLSYVAYDSDVMGVRAEYAVYTPPGFRRDERLPLVVFLHGGGDDERAFDRHGIAGALDRAIRNGEAPRVVVVLPDGHFGFWADWYDGSRRYESWIVHELVPRVREVHGTRGCHLMGVSMGGSGVLRMALHHPQRFDSVSVISAPIFDTEDMIDFANDRLLSIFIPTDRVFGPTEPRDRWRIERSDPFVQWRSGRDLGNTRLLLAWGTRDGARIRASSERLTRHLEAHGVPHVANEFDGEHAWTSWAPVIVDALRRQLVER